MGLYEVIRNSTLGKVEDLASMCYQKNYPRQCWIFSKLPIYSSAQKYCNMNSNTGVMKALGVGEGGEEEAICMHIFYLEHNFQLHLFSWIYLLK